MNNHEKWLQEAKRKDFLTMIKLAPFIVSYMGFCAWFYWYMVIDSVVFNDVVLWGFSKYILFGAALIPAGISLIFLAGSLTVIIAVHIEARRLQATVKSLPTLLLSALMLTFCLMFISLSKWLTGLTLKNAQEISNYLVNNFNHTHGLIEIITGFFIFFVFLMLCAIAFGLLISPFQNEAPDA